MLFQTLCELYQLLDYTHFIQGQRTGQWKFNRIGGRRLPYVLSTGSMMSKPKKGTSVSHKQQRTEIQKIRVLNPRKVRSEAKHPPLYLEA